MCTVKEEIWLESLQIRDKFFKCKPTAYMQCIIFKQQMAGIPCSSQKKRSESCFLVEKNCISKAFILVDFFLFPQLLSWLKKVVFPFHIPVFGIFRISGHQISINVTNYSKSPTKSKFMQKYSSEDTRKVRAPKRKTSCSCSCFRHTWGFSAVTFVRTQCERNVALWHWKIHLFLLFLYKHRFFHHLYGFMKMSKMEYERSQTVTTNL